MIEAWACKDQTSGALQEGAEAGNVTGQSARSRRF